MADAQNEPLSNFICTGIIESEIDEMQARDIVLEWIYTNVASMKSKERVKLGKAVLIYYPFWKYIREDGGVDKIIYRPACGTLLNGMQDMKRVIKKTSPVPENISIIHATVNSNVYLPTLYGIERGEELIAIPFWLVSYKFKNSIYMTKVDACSGAVYPEWHPIKEHVNWVKTALLVLVPMMIISFIAVLVNPWLFLINALYLLILIYQSKVAGIINLKSMEGKDGF